MASPASDTNPKDASAPQVEWSDESPAIKRVEVEVPAKRVAIVYERAYREIARGAQIPGFRRGKTPRSVLRKMYGASMAGDIERQLVQETLPEALQNQEVFPVSEPQVETQTPTEGQPFRYSAVIEVRPSIDLAELDGLRAERPSDVVDDEAVDAALENLRQRQASLVEASDDTVAAAGHILTMDFEGRIAGEPFEGGTGKDVQIELGANQLLPDFEAGLLGAQAGEARTLNVTFPEDYGDGAVSGKDVVFEAQVKSLQRREVPDLDDEFAKDLGEFDDLAALRARARKDLEGAKKREVKAALRTSLLDSILERVEFEVPPRLIEERLEQRIAQAQQDLQQRGMPEALLHAQRARFEEEGRPAVEREIREAWVLAQVGKDQSLEVGDEELDQRLGEMAEEQGMDAEELRKAYRQHSEYLDAIRGELLQDRAVEFLLGGATVEEISSPTNDESGDDSSERDA